MNDSCASCRFYRDQHCHRNPPYVMTPGGWNETAWPSPADTDWCGEFQAKPASALQEAVDYVSNHFPHLHKP